MTALAGGVFEGGILMNGFGTLMKEAPLSSLLSSFHREHMRNLWQGRGPSPDHAASPTSDLQSPGQWAIYSYCSWATHTVAFLLQQLKQTQPCVKRMTQRSCIPTHADRTVKWMGRIQVHGSRGKAGVINILLPYVKEAGSIYSVKSLTINVGDYQSSGDYYSIQFSVFS